MRAHGGGGGDGSRGGGSLPATAPPPPLLAALCGRKGHLNIGAGALVVGAFVCKILARAEEAKRAKAKMRSSKSEEKGKVKRGKKSKAI